MKEGCFLLRPARNRLQAAGVRYNAEAPAGDVAHTIADHTKVRGCDSIVMGTRGTESIADLLMNPAAAKAARMTEVPVTPVLQSSTPI